MRKVGVIVGNGKLPLYFLKEAAGQNLDLYPIGLFDTIQDEIKKHPNFISFNIGCVGDIIKYLYKNEISEIVMLGKVEKELIFKEMKFDKHGEELLSKLPDRKDETLLFAVILLLKRCKIKVLPQNHMLKGMMFKEGCYTKKTPSEIDKKTIEIGIKAAKALSSVDAGQSVILKDRSVIALEGIEGTDEMIKRGGALAGSDVILVKMARPQQDMRVDIPAIGINTIERLIEIGASGLVAESNRMLFLEKDECIALADKHNLFILAI